jgi:hypothetical protein
MKNNERFQETMRMTILWRLATHGADAMTPERITTLATTCGLPAFVPLNECIATLHHLKHGPICLFTSSYVVKLWVNTSYDALRALAKGEEAGTHTDGVSPLPRWRQQ